MACGQTARHRWDARVEVSFNHFGDRGRYDLIALHPRTRVLVVVEVKTAFGDLQELFGRLDVKTRLARQTAQTLGWRPIAVVPFLLLAEDSTMRRRVRDHPALFERFVALRGLAAYSWLRRPSAQQLPTGLLVFHSLSGANHERVIRARRVRNGQVLVPRPRDGATRQPAR